MLSGGGGIRNFLFIVAQGVVFGGTHDEVHRSVFGVAVLHSVRGRRPCGRRSRVITRSLGRCVSQLVTILPGERHRVFLVDERRGVACQRVTTQYNVNRGTMRQRVRLALGFLGGGLLLFVLFSVLPR